MAHYKAVIVGAGRMAGTIDDECVDYPGVALPYCHAAGYAAVPEVELLAFADPLTDKVRSLQERYGVPRGYEDYREMIEREKPDIVSVCTPATVHCEAVLFAAEHGARAIYCEKALCCSLAEADRMTEAVESRGIKFNTGTLRRWAPGMEALRGMIEQGDLGGLQAVITYSVGGMLHSASHFFDLMLYLAGDPELEWIQGTVTDGDFDPAAARWDNDLSGIGQFRLSNGVMGHVLSTGLWAEFAAIGSEGSVAIMNNGVEFGLRRREPICGGKYYEFHPAEFPPYERGSATVRLISDLVQALDTGGETRQGIRRAVNTAEIAFGIIESHRQGGARVALPLARRDFWMHSH
ncbi:MAG: Gfo/Idh/MocA family oxidoreductase [Armatimonadetes bacterium]|nr:Gfo/Idh/MocA family oxidoreductase [Armatimonadota bacterium]